jgi:uncharacterized protein (DUF1015 family)
VSPQQRAELAAHAHNILSIVLPEDRDGDGPTSKHGRAGALLREWIQGGTMMRDAKPAFYLYTIEHGAPETRRRMSAMLCRLRLDATGKMVRPHEKTLLRPRRDRFHLRVETRTDCEPIWLLYRDENAWVEELLESNAFEELSRFTDEQGHDHRLWRVDRSEAVGEIIAQFDDRTLVIADGHHRYQTALEHHAETQRAEDGSILVALVRDNDPGLAIEATHRLIHSTRFADAAAALAVVKGWIIEEVTPVTPELAGLCRDSATVVVVGKVAGTKRAWRLTMKDPPKDSPLSRLAVSRVHQHLLTQWGISPDKPEDHIRFSRDNADALAALDDGRAQFSVLLPPETPASVLEVAQAGLLMPQKATYFVPKLRSGIVLSPLDEALPRGWQDQVTDPGRPDTRLPRL